MVRTFTDVAGHQLAYNPFTAHTAASSPWVICTYLVQGS
jgi:hypothetical protein